MLTMIFGLGVAVPDGDSLPLARSDDNQLPPVKVLQDKFQFNCETPVLVIVKAWSAGFAPKHRSPVKVNAAGEDVIAGAAAGETVTFTVLEKAAWSCQVVTDTVLIPEVEKLQRLFAV